MDDDGYPDEDELARVSTWPYTDLPGWFAYVKGLWWAPEWGWHEEDGRSSLDKPARVYQISTGGWSGNESLIDAMQENRMCWVQTWESSRRGGHFTFAVDRVGEPAGSEG